MGAICTKSEAAVLDRALNERIIGECKPKTLCLRLQQFVQLQTAIEEKDDETFDRVLSKIGNLQVFLDDTRNILTPRQQDFAYLLLNPLHKACFHHNTRYISQFLKGSVDIYRLDDKGRSPVEVLLRSWNKQYVDVGETIMEGNPHMSADELQRLYENKVNAVKQNSLECFKILMNAYDDLSLKFGSDKVTALHLSLEVNIPEVAEYLIANGADVESRTRLGNTPLILAAKHFNIWSMVALLEKGANVNAENSDGMTALHYICMGIHRSKHAIDLLVKYGANVNAQNSMLYTPLHHAAIAEEYGKIHKLLQYDADPDIETREGKNVLYFLMDNISGPNPSAAMAYNHALCEMKRIKIRDFSDFLPINLVSGYPGLAERFDDVTSKPRPLKQLALIRVKRILGRKRQTPLNLRRLKLPRELCHLIQNCEENNDILTQLGIPIESQQPRPDSGEDTLEFPVTVRLGYGLRWANLDMS